MDGEGFDRWVRTLDVRIARRGLTTLLGGMAAAGTIAGGEAKKKKKKKKKPSTPCAGDGASCSGTESCCSRRCCLEVDAPVGGPTICNAAEKTCCTAGQGGGSCPAAAPVCCSLDTVPGKCTTAAFPVCCPANAVQPQSYSCPASGVCCGTGTGCCLARITGEAARENLTARPLRAKDR